MGTPTPAISIIIPVYEAKDTLERCVGSLIDEGLSGLYEIILVDDGSRDGSGDVCDVFAQRHPSIVRVLHQDNAGVSAARNAGINIAAGTYLAFVDADDYVTSSYLNLCLSAVLTNDSDIILFDYIRESIGNRRIVKPPFEPTDIESIKYLMLTCECNSPCTKLYKREICREVKFPLGQSLGEDLVFNLRFLEATGSSSYIPNALYVYAENENSRMAGAARLEDAHDYELMLQSLLSYCHDCLLGERGRNAALSSMRRIIASYAAKLNRQSINSDKISKTINGIGGIQEVIDAPVVGWKDAFRKIVLSRRLYPLAGVVLRGK